MVSPEEFCDNVKLALIAGLQDALDAQTARWAAADAAAGRQISLAAPRAEDYYLGGASIITRYPTVELAVSDLAFTALSLGNYDGDARPRLHVKASFQEARDSEWLYRMGCRWFAALMTVVAEPGVFGEVDIDTDRGVTAAWRFNPQTAEQDEIQTFVLATFNLLGPLTPFAA